MTRRLEGKRILVTAAAQGIGAAIARHCAEAGARVLATDVNTEVLEKAFGAVSGITCAPLDVLDSGAVAALAERPEPFDVLINCAGFVHHGSILDSTEDDMAFAMDLNVMSMVRTVRAVLPGMLAAGQGSIVNIASICATRGLPNRCAYSASKAAVIGLTKTIAADFVARGIRCNTISPGTVETPSLDDRINAFDDPVEARKAFIARQPMGRMGRPEEIAAVAVYLASDESVFTTGVNFQVDGGMSI